MTKQLFLFNRIWAKKSNLSSCFPPIIEKDSHVYKANLPTIIYFWWRQKPNAPSALAEVLRQNISLRHHFSSFTAKFNCWKIGEKVFYSSIIEQNKQIRTKFTSTHPSSPLCNPGVLSTTRRQWSCWRTSTHPSVSARSAPTRKVVKQIITFNSKLSSLRRLVKKNVWKMPNWLDSQKSHLDCFKTK